MDNKKVQTLDGEIMLVQEVPCQVKLNDHQWTVASVDKGIHNKTTKYGLPTY